MALSDPFDPNDLPEQDQKPGLLRGTLVLWLIAISAAVLLVPLFFVLSTIRSDANRLQADIQTVQESLTSVGTPAPEIQALMNDLDQAQSAISEIESAHSAVAAGHTDWPAVMSAIGNYNPAQLTLTSLAQSDNQVTLNGQAVDDSAVIAYSRALEESGLFSRVVVQSIKSIATPLATSAAPTSTATIPPGTPLTPTATITAAVTTTPTPGQADEYETDDFQPRDIAVGQPQLHNLYPIYDVDKVKFLAKAGRYYRVYTSDLIPGVDTFLTVNAGGITYTNDDREPGDYSSEIAFQVPTNRDVDAVVKVTNRGQYGPDMWYQITVEEIVPTPTATPTPTSTPSPTATPVSPPTPTPDLRDEYEPDDTNPNPIAVGEAQTHSFYPDNDTDKVEFLAKAGRYYRVSTSDLTPGVDTLLTVSLPGVPPYTNDDRGPGDYGSEIVFQAPTDRDVDAVAKVTNRGQYGPEMRYQITVEEIVPTPTPTLTPTPTTTPTPTEASSSPPLRLFDPTSLVSGFPLADVQIMTERTDILLPSSARGNGKTLIVSDPETVEFVIVLELRTASP